MRANRFGILGCVAGLVALGFAALPMWVLPMIFPPPPASAVIAETVVGIKERLAAKARGTEYQPHRQPAADERAFWDRACSTTGVALGLAALALGVVSAIRREHWRYSAIAAALGIGAMLFEIVTTAMAVLVAVALVLALLQFVGLGP